jgi:uncharacterized phage protein gp47/JayE
MSLQTNTYDQFLSNIVTTWAQLLRLSPNLQSGDPLLAVFQALVLGGFIFVQSQVKTVNLLTRAATSSGADLDTWMADFSFTRLPAIAASGTVQFSVNRVLSSNVKIPLGTIIQTLDATIQYQVIADLNQSAYTPSQNAYVLPAGDLEINVTVQAVKTGSAQNVQVAALNTLVSSISGINNVTNLAAFQNGADAESDAAFRNRFKLFINSVNGKATPGGIYSAALNTPGVVACSVIENFDQYGNPRPGYGTIVVDDGSGNPTSDLLNTVFNNVFVVRGFTTEIAVVGPTKVNVAISLNVKIVIPIGSIKTQSTVLTAVEFAIIDYVNSLEIGDTLYLSEIIFAAMNADPTVKAVQPGATTLNSAQADLVATPQEVIRTDNTRIAVGTYT